MGKKYAHPGKPVTHPKVCCLETGEVFDTYTAAADSVGGSRTGIRRCVEGIQKHHKGYHWTWYFESEHK